MVSVQHLCEAQRRNECAPMTKAKFQAYSKPFLKGEGGSKCALFQPLDQIHLYSSDFKYDMAVRGNISYVNALTIIALFILLIACFNFVNLATSRSLQRAKEVGVRKQLVREGPNSLYNSSMKLYCLRPSVWCWRLWLQGYCFHP
jgi:hypothetical protein